MVNYCAFLLDSSFTIDMFGDHTHFQNLSWTFIYYIILCQFAYLTKLTSSSHESSPVEQAWWPVSWGSGSSGKDALSRPPGSSAPDSLPIWGMGTVCRIGGIRFPGLRWIVGGLTGCLGSGEPVGFTGLTARSKSDEAGGVKGLSLIWLPLIPVVGGLCRGLICDLEV